MSVSFGRFARALLLTGGIATALALPSIAGTPLLPTDSGVNARVVMAAPAMNNDNNDDPTNDNSEERNLRGQVIELHEDLSPPEALVATTGENVWVRIYLDQIHNSGMRLGDHVSMKGEYGEHGIFDAYQIDVDDRCCDDNGNDNN